MPISDSNVVSESIDLKRRFAEPVGTAAVISLLVISGAISFFNLQSLWANSQRVSHSHQVLQVIADIESAAKDAEARQQGFLISGDESVLAHFHKAVQSFESLFRRLNELTASQPERRAHVPPLRALVTLRIQQWTESIELRQTVGAAEARAVDIGHSEMRLMDQIRGQLGAMRAIEESLLRERSESSERIYRTALLTTLISTIAGLSLLAGVMYLNQRRRIRAELDAAMIFQERERLQVTLASIGDGVVVCDAACKVTYLNVVAEGLTQWTNQEAQGKSLESVFRIIDENTRMAAENPAMSALREEAIVGLTSRSLLISKSGTETPIDDSAAPIRDAAGKIDGVVLVFRDVTERRNEDHRLREAVEFTRNVVDGLNEFVIVLDGDRRVLNTNRAFLNAFGLNESDTTGVPLHELIGSQLDFSVIQSLLEQLSQEHPPADHADRTPAFINAGDRVLQFSASRFDAGHNRPDCVLLVMSDVTDQRQLQESNRRLDQHMRWFLEQIQDYAIFMVDTQFRASTWNRGVEQVLGFSENEFKGQDIRQLIFTPEAIANGTAEAEFATAAHTGNASDDRWMMRKGGQRFWASGITGAVRDENGNLIGYSKVMRDLTLRKQAQDDLAELASKLSEEGRRKNEFLATLAHELRNPLAPIKNAVQLMGMSPLSGELEELRETMARQVEQLVRLIDDLLDVSRISRGKIVLRKEVVDLHEIINAAVEASMTFIKESGQELVVELADEELMVEVDPARVAQIISNLLNNSAKYSDAGCKIQLTASTENSMAVLSVRDNGIGIASERLEDIFQMFSQVNDSLERGTAGLGIGLTLVKTLVELHGGTVTAQSEGVGHGSRFTVRLPLTAKPGPAKPDDTPPGTGLLAPSFRILVVEDMRALSMVMARLLQKLGHQVQVVENGVAALEKLDSWRADLIFSDISMPGMTGYELAQRLRQRSDTARVFLVAMTGYGQLSDRDHALQAGFDKHLVKPVDVRQLHSIFAELIQRQAQQPK